MQSPAYAPSVEEKFMNEMINNYINKKTQILKAVRDVFIGFQMCNKRCEGDEFFKVNSLLPLVKGVVYREKDKYNGVIKNGLIPQGQEYTTSAVIKYTSSDVVPLGIGYIILWEGIDSLFKTYEGLFSIEVHTDQRTGELLFKVAINGMFYYDPIDTSLPERIMYFW